VNIAPDYAEPLEGWRVWKLVRREGAYALASVVQRTTWPAGEPLTALCLRAGRLADRLRRRPPHDAPAAACECGIYATTIDRVGPYLAEPPFRAFTRILGKVALWGAVIECERGFRASHAYPLRLYVPADAGRAWRVAWEEVAFSLSRYRVPIEELEPGRRDIARVVAEREAAHH
jgi:hypothetical protein